MKSLLLCFFFVTIAFAKDVGLKSSVDGKESERDPALQKFTYDIGNGPEETLIYVEPDVTSFYKDIPSPSSTKVRPKFNGHQCKFINMSNKPLDLYWEASRGGKKHFMFRFKPFQAHGTSSFPSHSFVFTPLDDEKTILYRMVMKSFPDSVYHYDPFQGATEEETEKNLKVLSTDERQQYDDWKKTLLFNELYKEKTGRAYLANYLRKPPMHYLWPATHLNQTHWVETYETHFHALPSSEKLDSITEYTRYKADEPRNLHEFRSPGKLNMTLRVISCAPRVLEIPDFLSDDEVDHIINVAKAAHLKKSSTGSTSDPKNSQDDRSTRTSYNTWVDRHKDPIIDSIYRRGADVMHIDEAWLRHRGADEFPKVKNKGGLAEALQLVHYGPGQEYTAHHDFGFANIARGKEQGARFATLLLYLNEGMEGGETSFPRWANAETFKKLNVTPKRGRAVLFYSQLPDGNLDDLSHHAAEPVTDGEKWLINLWTWDPVYN